MGGKYLIFRLNSCHTLFFSRYVAVKNYLTEGANPILPCHINATQALAMTKDFVLYCAKDNVQIKEENMKLSKYKNKFDYSYAFGTFPTLCLLEKMPTECLRVMVHDLAAKGEKIGLLERECKKSGVPIEYASKAVEKLRDKDSVLVIGVFKKFSSDLSAFNSHLVLVNPSDMGNLGTIMRTSLGFSVCDIAIISPAADYFNPKVVRASMGAVFGLRIRCFESFDEYYDRYSKERQIYTFMLNGEKNLNELSPNADKPYSLVFGNESSGLPDHYLNVGKSVYIAHSTEVDSLNLSIAVGISLHKFTCI